MGRSDKGDGKEASFTSSLIGTPPQGAHAFCRLHRKALRWWRWGWAGGRGSPGGGQDVSGLGSGRFNRELVLSCAPHGCPHCRPAGPGLWLQRQRDTRASPVPPPHTTPGLEESSHGGEGEGTRQQVVLNPVTTSHQRCDLGAVTGDLGAFFPCIKGNAGSL